MITIRKTTPSKAWRLIRHKPTGDILTDEHNLYQLNHEDLKNKMIATHDAIANGQTVPMYNFGRYWQQPKPSSLEEFEQLDHIPVMRGDFEFDAIHNGTSSIQIYFRSRAGTRYTLKGDHANDFFQRVGKSKILMSPDGFYTFNFTFTKSSTKVFLLLEPDNAHV
jgi:hypothetical protein